MFFGHWDSPSWLGATYSPWLWTCNLAQALLYAGVALAVWAFRVRRVAAGAAAGAVAGLTFLAHTAPALLLAGVVLSVSTTAAWSARGERRALRALALLLLVFGVTAVATSAPFWWSIVSYGAKLRNSAPLDWVVGHLTVARWREPLVRELTLRGAFAGVGLVALLGFRWPERPYARPVLLAWLGVVILGLAYGYARQLAEFPPLLPSWHFYFYLQAFLAVSFGCGVGFAVSRLVRVISQRSWLPALPSPVLERWGFAATLLASSIVVVVRWGQYRERDDIVANRAEAVRFAKMPTNAVYDWLLKETRPNDVVLADDVVGFYAVQAAGRKVVALQDLFSNPYVDVKRRERDSAAMFKALRAARVQRFLSLARRYRVRFVILDRGVSLPAKSKRALRELEDFPRHRIYALRSRSSR